MSIAFNDALAELASNAQAAGLPVETFLTDWGMLRMRFVGNNELTIDTMTKRVGYGSTATQALMGIYIRYGCGRGSQGTIRYPLRKDGTVDFDRWKADLEEWRRRKQREAEVQDIVAANKLLVENKVAVLREEARKRNGGLVFAEVENDGRMAGFVRFKVSGHAEPGLVMALLGLIEKRQD